LIAQDAVHHRDLAGRTTEAEQRDTKPNAERLSQRDSVFWLGVSWIGSLALNDRKLSHPFVSFVPCVCHRSCLTIATPGVERVVDDHPMPEHLVIVGKIGREPLGSSARPQSSRLLTLLSEYFVEVVEDVSAAPDPLQAIP